MVDEGEAVPSLPDRPVSVEDLETIEQHERVESVTPLEPEGLGIHIEQFELRTTAGRYVLEFAGDGWELVERSRREQSPPDDSEGNRSTTPPDRQRQTVSTVATGLISVTYSCESTDRAWWFPYHDPDGGGWD